MRVKDTIVATVRPLVDIQERERRRLLAEFTQVKGLMPLLMKQRNHQPWSAADREEIQQHMQRLAHLSPYIVILVLPGSFVMLPLFAWWMDRRRGMERKQ
jgi:hypothetical protein